MVQGFPPFKTGNSFGRVHIWSVNPNGKSACSCISNVCYEDHEAHGPRESSAHTCLYVPLFGVRLPGERSQLHPSEATFLLSVSVSSFVNKWHYTHPHGMGVGFLGVFVTSFIRVPSFIESCYHRKNKSLEARRSGLGSCRARKSHNSLGLSLSTWQVLTWDGIEGSFQLQYSRILLDCRACLWFLVTFPHTS